MTLTHSSASLSVNGKYRYSLNRFSPNPVRNVLWVMLNPSTADAENNDPTIRRLMSFTEAWGFDSMSVVNLYAFRATDPRELRLIGEGVRRLDVVGRDNDVWIGACARSASLIVCAWGQPGPYEDRARNVRALLHLNHHEPLHCLRVNKNGHPSHPLYLPKSLTPKVWT